MPIALLLGLGCGTLAAGYLGYALVCNILQRASEDYNRQMGVDLAKPEVKYKDGTKITLH